MALNSIRSFKFEMKPRKLQAISLNQMLKDFCSLYNAALEQRIDAYRKTGKGISFVKQCNELPRCREEDKLGLGRWSASAAQQVLKRLDQTYSAFFKRSHGFPRFKASKRYCSAIFRFGNGLTIQKDCQLRITGVVDGIKIRWHRPLPENGQILTAILSKKQNKWYVIFQVEAIFGGNCGQGGVGVDLGLSSLVATSDGQLFAAPKFERKAHKAQRIRQRALSRCKRGSKRREKVRARLAAGSAKIARQRRDHAHKLSRTLVSKYNAIAFEQLNMAGLTKGMLARSVHDAGWSMLVRFTKYKAESAGASVVLVDPRGTSQTCPQCFAIKRKQLSDRVHKCPCGCVLDRDVAAAKIVRHRAFGPGHGLQPLSQQSAA